jgi:inosine-uridine nucleoside N-ribohydrolase
LAPVTIGADEPGQRTAAAERIAALPAGTHLLALGPLTNLAQALRIDPKLERRITVSVVGGNLSSIGRWPPYWPYELNLARDVGAAHTVFRSALPRRIYPLDVCRHLTVGAGFLHRLSRGAPLGRTLARGSWRWLAHAPVRYRALSFPLWDLVPALDLLGLLEHKETRRRLACRGRGLLVDDGGAEEAVCVRSFDAAAALAAFERLLG